VDVDAITSIVEEVGQTQVMSRFGALRPDDVRDKGTGDLVTVADVAAERELTHRLAAAVPGSAVVGEEAVASDPALLETLGAEGAMWVIDPIDGTMNFARGIPVFAVMVAFVVDGVTEAAWIHDPYHFRTAVAQRGSGSFIDGTRLSTSSPSAQDQDLRGAVYAGRFSAPALSAHLHRRKRSLRSVATIACAGWEYLRLAGGGNDFALFTRTMPWDHLSGILIHEEAGGWTRRIDGLEYTATESDGPALLIAANRECWNRVHGVLIGDAPPED
jgi:fructose-1,6-bisphosphatase/inositol monophosphatase family enzyme